LAVLLARPHWPFDDTRVETVNDKNAHIANVWRAIAAAPDEIAKHVDWPVNEVDLFARHKHLVGRIPELRSKLEEDPNYFDAKLAAWWVWGLSIWIGSGWCAEKAGKNPSAQIPFLAGAGKGIVAQEDVHRKLPDLHSQRGVHRKIPHLRNAGQGVNRQIPHLRNAGQGVNAVNRKMPAGGDGWAGVNTPALEQGANVLPYLQALASRLRHVRVCCGEWDRVLGPSATTSLGMCGILFDPPYSSDAVDQVKVYDDLSDPAISGAVREWCVEHGEDANLRIALCGYEGEHNELEKHGWSKVYWKAQGGYGCQRKDGVNENRRKERIWFNPACISNELPFEEMSAEPVGAEAALFGDDEDLSEPVEDVEVVAAEDEDIF
jgi:hypothetical protein